MRFFLSALLLWSTAAFADNLMPEGNFELPFVKGRTPANQGGDPTQTGRPNHQWISFNFRTDPTNPQIVGGLTDEVARNGRQALYIRFIHADRPLQSAKLISNFIPVVSGTQYEVGIWGLTDAKDLIDSEGKSAYLKVEVDYFAKDANESVGDPKYSVQPIPGSKGHAAYFVPNQWRRYYVQLTPPQGAIFAQVIWTWQTGSDAGEINGTMYFDDATLMGPPAANPDMTPSPVQQDATPDASATPAQ